MATGYEKFNFRKQVPAHNVVHVIDTANEPPSKAKLRPIMPGTKKYEMGKITEMEKWYNVHMVGFLVITEPL